MRLVLNFGVTGPRVEGGAVRDPTRHIFWSGSSAPNPPPCGAAPLVTRLLKLSIHVIQLEISSWFHFQGQPGGGAAPQLDAVPHLDDRAAECT